MKQRKKRYQMMAWFLALSLLIGQMGGIPLVSAASVMKSGNCGENTWKLDSEGTLYLEGKGQFPTYSSESVPWNLFKEEIRQVVFEFPLIAGGDLSNYFDGCINLMKVNEIPAGTTKMNETFRGCSMLNCEVGVPEKVTEAFGTFDGCTSLAITPKIQTKKIQDIRYLFRNTAITQAPTIPKSVTDMEGCFYGCSNLRTPPILPNGVRDLSYCFYGCQSMTSCPQLPEGVVDIRYAFYKCRSMTNASDIPLSVEYMQNCMVECVKVSGEMTIYAMISKKERYHRFAGETAIYDIQDNPKFLGGSGRGLKICYTVMNENKIRDYLSAGWNCGGLVFEGKCGKLQVGDRVNIDMGKVSVGSLPSYPYTGNANTPKPTVTYGKEQLVEGQHFTYSYSNHIDAGQATLKIQGRGGFEGVRNMTYNILTKALENVKSTGYTGTYDGNPHSIMVQSDIGAKIRYGTKAGEYLTETCPQYILPGKYTTYYQVTKPNYTTMTGSATVVIEERIQEAKSSGFKGEYDGLEHGIQVLAEEGATVTYGTKEGEYTDGVSPKYRNAGQYTVYYQVSKLGYKTIHGKEKIEIQKKKVYEIEFPSVGDLVYGQSLQQADLSQKQNPYGWFQWLAPEKIPTVQNHGYPMVFEPNDTKNYDFSEVSGYENGRCSRNVSVRVLPQDGVVPEVKITCVLEDDILSMATFESQGIEEGVFQWETPLQVVKQSETEYDAKFIPQDTENYNWSKIEGYDEESGSISLKMNLMILPRPVAGAITYGDTLEKSILVYDKSIMDCVWEESDLCPQESGFQWVCIDTGEVCFRRQIWVSVQEPIQPTMAPVVTETPKETNSPIATGAPTETIMPVVTEVPAETIPVDTEKPVETIPPIIVEKPEETKSPSVTEKPRATISPSVTEKPQETMSPIGADEPMGTMPPTETIMPVVTEVPAETIPIDTETSNPTETTIPTTRPVIVPSASEVPTGTNPPTEYNEVKTTEVPVVNSKLEISYTSGKGQPEKTVESVEKKPNDALSVEEEHTKTYDKKITDLLREIDANGKRQIKKRKVVIKSVKRKGKKVKLSWKKEKNAVGYQVWWWNQKKARKKGVNKRYTRKKVMTIKKRNTKKCYLKIRAVYYDGTRKVYGSWSKTKRI